jgi:hypothetical protein
VRDLRLTPAEFRELSDQILSDNSQLRFLATGQSMSPFVKHGDVLWVNYRRQLLPGQAILCRVAMNRIVAHRIIHIKQNTVGSESLYLVKGDSLNASDGWVSHSAIMGCVEAIERNGKTISTTTQLWRLTGLTWQLAKAAKTKNLDLFLTIHQSIKLTILRKK